MKMKLEVRDSDKDKLYHVHFKVSLKCLKNDKFVIHILYYASYFVKYLSDMSTQTSLWHAMSWDIGIARWSELQNLGILQNIMILEFGEQNFVLVIFTF